MSDFESLAVSASISSLLVGTAPAAFCILRDFCPFLFFSRWYGVVDLLLDFFGAASSSAGGGIFSTFLGLKQDLFGREAM